MRRSLFASLASALVSLALIAAPATAGTAGTYVCPVAGTLELKSNGKYEFRDEKGGKWTKDGKRIIFKSGFLEAKVYGKLKRGVLKVYDAETKELQDKCTRE